MTEQNVITAISAVTGKLKGIGKDQKAAAQQGGYAYRGIEDITRALQPLLAEHGIVFVPRVQQTSIKEVEVNGKPWTDTILHVEYDVYGPGGSLDKIVAGPFVGIGRDNSDKGANKAMTQVFKYLLLQLFAVSDANDDADSGSPATDVKVQNTPAKQPQEPPAAHERPIPEGWFSWDDCNQKHADISARIKAVKAKSEPNFEVLRNFKQENGWPLTADKFEELSEIILLMEAGGVAE